MGKSLGHLIKKENFCIQKNSKQQVLDYSVYPMRIYELLLIITGILLVLVGISFIFYQSLWVIPFLLPIGLYFWRQVIEFECQKRKKKFLLQFRDCIKHVMTILKAGYSVENAFMESIDDMKLMHGEESFIVTELKLISNGLKNNMNLEDQLMFLGERSGCEDIQEFATVFRLAKRGGGNITQIMEDSIILLDKKMEIDSEIDIEISSKKLESIIMEMVPFGIIAYISVTSPGYFSCLYHNVLGNIIMTSCLIAYCVGFWLSRRIVQIEV